MKKLFYLLISVLTLASCSVIKEDDRYIKVDLAESSDRTVLLMDFTGWKCVNCPDAAKIAEKLTKTYPENCIVVSMHPEGISFTDPGEAGPDLASKEAMEYLKAFGGSAGTGLPKGVVDMTEYDDEYLLDPALWTGAFAERMKDTACYSVNVKADETSYTVDIECVKGTADTTARLLVWLVEDSIEGMQLAKQGEIDNYMHRHVFRRCLNGTDIWGEDVYFESGEAQLSGTFKLDPLVGTHYIVVAILVDEDNHVLQASEAVINTDAPVKNPGFFTICDAANENEYGDTVHVTHYNKNTGEMIFDGYINIDDQSDVDFYLDEEREFPEGNYIVSFCAFENCWPDVNHGHWGPYDAESSTAYDFQYHVMLPVEARETKFSFSVRMTFSNGNPLATKYVVVVFDYEPVTPE